MTLKTKNLIKYVVGAILIAPLPGVLILALIRAVVEAGVQGVVAVLLFVAMSAGAVVIGTVERRRKTIRDNASGKVFITDASSKQVKNFEQINKEHAEQDAGDVPYEIMK